MKTLCTRLAGSAVVSVLALGLAACGGNPWDPDRFTPDFSLDWDSGSIALNAVTLEAGITANYPSQAEADAEAIRTCGGAACGTVLRFSGKGVCGALARSTNRHVGVATGGSLDAARSQAIVQCAGQGGTDCVAGLLACND